MLDPTFFGAREYCTCVAVNDDHCVIVVVLLNMAIEIFCMSKKQSRFALTVLHYNHLFLLVV